jgi:hypothetical protein
MSIAGRILSWFIVPYGERDGMRELRAQIEALRAEVRSMRGGDADAREGDPGGSRSADVTSPPVGQAGGDSEKDRAIETLLHAAMMLSELDASRVISRADNKQLFEIPWQLKRFAENILNEYGDRGLWLCVHCVIAHASTETHCTSCKTERGEWRRANDATADRP